MKIKSVITALVLCAAGSALAQEVTYNAMPGVEFGKYKTYKWVKIDGAVQPDQILDTEIRTALDAELVSKGLTKSEADTADVFVGYQVSVNQEKQWNAYGGGMGWRMGGGMATATSSTLSVGTLGFDVYDPKGKQLIWRGAATKTLDEKPSPDKRQKNLDKAVKKLLKDFPPPAGK